MKILKKITHIAALLTALVLLTVTVSPAFAAGKTEQIRTGDVVCFGTPDAACGFDGKWLVLDSEHTNTGAPGMFLVSLNLIGSEQGRSLLFRDIGEVSVSFSDRGEAFAEEHPGSTDYQGSDIQTWCEDFAQNHLTQAEYQALLPTWKSDAAAVIPGLGIPLPGAMNGTVDFDPVENILNGDRLFLLSAEEITNEQYGFSDGSSRIAAFKGTAEGYWLRSPHIPTFPLDVGFVFGFDLLDLRFRLFDLGRGEVVVAIFPYESIVEFPYYRSCLHRNLKFLLQMFVASLHEKLQTIVFASKVF